MHILDDALGIYPSSPELLAQRDYVHRCFGIGNTMREQPDDIFHSDDDDEVPFISNPPKRVYAEHTDSQVMEKLLQNVEGSLGILMGEIHKGSMPGVK